VHFQIEQFLSSNGHYVDEPIWRWQSLKRCHLLADNADQLHRFAANLGIKRTSFQSPPKVTTPHYDPIGYERLRALAMGAVACNKHEIVAVVRRIRVDQRSVGCD
jgi:hypothetical protein